MTAVAMQSNRSGHVDPKIKKMMPFPIYGVHHIRNNPQPAYVKHFIGLDNEHIRDVRAQYEDYGMPPSTPIVDPLKKLTLREIPYKERAVPHFGMIPVSEPWRGELMNLTESVLDSIWNDCQSLPQMELTDMRPLPVRRPLTSWMMRHPQKADWRPSVQMNQGSSRPDTRMSDISIKPIKKDGINLPSIDKPNSRNGEPESNFQDLQFVHSKLDGVDFEAQVFGLLCQILNVRSLSSIQKWLHCSSDVDRARIVEIIKEIFTTRAKEEENSLAPIQEESDEDKGGEINILALEDRPVSQSARLYHMAQKRPVTSVHSPFIYRPSSVANKRLTSSVPSLSSSASRTRLTEEDNEAPEKGHAPIRLRLSTGVSRSSSSFQASYSEHMMHRNVAITADGYSRPAAEQSVSSHGKFYGLKNII